MLSTVVGKAADLLDKRFLVGLFLPSAGFFAALGALAFTGVGWDKPYNFWKATPTAGHWTLGVVIAAGVLLFAVLLGTQVILLMQIWEGYWRPRWLRVPATWVQKCRYARLSDSADDTLRRVQQYPTLTDAFLPMRLGNVLLSAENYSRERYGLDSVYFWPRQYLALPSEVRSIVDDARRSIDQLIVIASLAVVTAVGAVAMACASWRMPATVSAPLAVWGPSALVATMIAYASYRSATSAAVVYGDLVRSAFDLYRGEVLEKLGVPAPKTRELERQTWEALGQFLFRGGTNSRAADGLIEYADSAEPPPSFQVTYQGRLRKKCD